VVVGMAAAADIVEKPEIKICRSVLRMKSQSPGKITYVVEQSLRLPVPVSSRADREEINMEQLDGN